MLEILGTIAGNILSLPGILGLAFGMMTRNFLLAALAGGLVGVGEAVMFARMTGSDILMLELAISVLVGVMAGCLGTMIRRKGTTV